MGAPAAGAAPDRRLSLALSQESEGRPSAHVAGSAALKELPSRLTCARRCRAPGAAHASGRGPPSWFPATFLPNMIHAWPMPYERCVVP